MHAIMFRKNGIYEHAVEMALQESGKEIPVLAFEPGASAESIRAQVPENMDIWGVIADLTCIRAVYSVEDTAIFLESLRDYVLDYMIRSRSEMNIQDGLRILCEKYPPKQIMILKENLEDHAPAEETAEGYWIKFFENLIGIAPQVCNFVDIPEDVDETTWVVQDRHCKFCGQWPKAPVVVEIPSENMENSLARFGIGDRDEIIRRLANSIKFWI